MTGPQGNSKFCFPEILYVSRGEAEGNIEVEGKQNSLFPKGPVIKYFVIAPNSKDKVEKTGSQTCSDFSVSLGMYWVLNHGTWHIFLQSENVFELEGITTQIFFLLFTGVFHKPSFMTLDSPLLSPLKGKKSCILIYYSKVL